MEITMLFEFPGILVLAGVISLLVAIILGVLANRNSEEEIITNESVDQILEGTSKKEIRKLKRKNKNIPSVTSMVSDIHDSSVEKFIETDKTIDKDKLEDTIALDLEQIELELENNVLYDESKKEEQEEVGEVTPTFEIREEVELPNNNGITFNMADSEELVEPIIINTTPVKEEESIAINTAPIEDKTNLTTFEDVFNKVEEDKVIEPIIENHASTMEIPIVSVDEEKPKVNLFASLRNKAEIKNVKEETDYSDNLPISDDTPVEENVTITSVEEPAIEMIAMPSFDTVVKDENGFNKEVVFEVPNDYKKDDFDSFKSPTIVTNEVVEVEEQEPELVYREDPIRESKPIYGGVSPLDTIDLTFVQEANKGIYNEES
jgi:hypothetical protein